MHSSTYVATLRDKNLKLKVEPNHEPMTANSYTALSAEGAENTSSLFAPARKSHWMKISMSWRGTSSLLYP